MIKTYSDFIATCSGKKSLYDQIPDEHLTVQGGKVYELYKTVMFNSCFADNAAEMLELMKAYKPGMESIAQYAPVEYKQIFGCLNRLAEAEAKAVKCGSAPMKGE